MKAVQPETLNAIPGRCIRTGERFRFRCHPDIGCFNRCCHNLNLFLYPYDVIRLKQCLGISSDQFIDRHVDVVLRQGNYFPDVLLRMSTDREQACPFLTDTGCTVYQDRPGTCRTFPLELGLHYRAPNTTPESIGFFRPPDFCQGGQGPDEWTLETWEDDQEAGQHNKMTRKWAELKGLFVKDPWQGQGPDGPKGRMAFMATYNIDEFREFVLASSFLKRYKVKKDLLSRIRKDDTALLLFGMDWVRVFVWGIPSKKIRPR
jgi:Fe-S-cluster containining protein